MSTEFDFIHTYTREQALADGTLVAATTELTAQVGFGVPVAYTAAVYADAIKWTPADTDRAGIQQDQTGREWDVLWMARVAAGRANADARVTFAMVRVPGDVPADPDDPAKPITLALAIGPGDHGEPVLTILQPHED